MNDLYHCYGTMDNRGRWRSWLFGPAAKQDRLVAEAVRYEQVLFASAQSFTPPAGTAGMMRWRQVRQQYVGENALPHIAPLYFDVDAEGDLEAALLWARTLVEFFTQQLELPEPAVRVWFSGSKGAHILVDAAALGIQPSATLTADMKAVALELVRHLAATGAPNMTIDSSVYSLPRMLRLADQVNPKSGLFKIELRHHELLQLAPRQIADLARRPRGSLWTPESLPTGPITKAAQWWASALARARQPREFRIQTAHIAGLKVRPDGYLVDELADASMPNCIAGMIRSAVGPGIRNRCELQIACWAKAAKLPASKALSLLAAWTARNRPELSLENAESKARSIADAVYANAAYGFSCAAARSAAHAAGVNLRCDECRAIRNRSFRQVFSLCIRRDEQWNPPLRIPLEEARGIVARAIDSRVAAAGANRPGHRAARGRQDPRRPPRTGRSPNAGRLRRPDARTGHAGAQRPSRPGRQDTLLAARA